MERDLEIGTGSGYDAARPAHLVEDDTDPGDQDQPPALHRVKTTGDQSESS